MKDREKSATGGVATDQTFSAEEKAAMRERAREAKADARRGSADEVDPETEVLAKIAEMGDRDRAMAERVHAIVMGVGLTPRLWYGQPAYAKGAKMICFFQPAAKFKTRYTTLGFSDSAKLDDDHMWPVYYAMTEITEAVEARIRALVQQAAG
ncbi:MAG TPA: hypothetical protein VIH37_08185 [Candidatus Limnocylindrales bacterium]